MHLTWIMQANGYTGVTTKFALYRLDKLSYNSRMKKQFLVGYLLVILCIVLSFPIYITYAENTHSATATINYEQLKEPLSQLVNNEMKKNDVVGLSIALVDDQQVVWTQGFGFANEKKRIAATPDTVYGIGSLTKLFTTTAALQLVERGRLVLDKPLKYYLPAFSIRSRFASDGSDLITLRHLMTHHSGLPTSIQKGMWSSKPTSFETVVNMLRDEYVAYPPNYIYADSTIDMTLLGHVIEKASGLEYVTFLQESLLQPLGMTQSGFYPPSEPNGSWSKGYHKDREMDEPLVRDMPALGMHSTVLDMGCFMKMIFRRGRSNGRDVLKPEMVEEMLSPQNSSVSLDLGLITGLGWMLSGLGEIDVQNAGTVAHLAGSTLLYHGQMIILPDHKLGVVVLANSSSSARAVNKAAVEAITLALEAKTGIKQPVQKKPVETEARLPLGVAQDYAGKYASLAGYAEIKPKTSYFHAEVMGRTLQLNPLADGRFSVKYRIFGLFPVGLGELDYYEIRRATIAGHEILKAGTKGRELLIAEKIHPIGVPEAWQKRVSKYGIDNLGSDFPLIENVRINSDNDLLSVECTLPFFFKGIARIPLKPVSDTEAVIYGLGSGLGETIRVFNVNGQELLV